MLARILVASLLMGALLMSYNDSDDVRILVTIFLVAVIAFGLGYLENEINKLKDRI